MHIRVHILPAAAAPTATLFALRHSAGHLLRDGDGKVILCSTAEDAERERRRNSASAPVSYVVALVPESDVREVDAVERLAEVLAKRLAPVSALSGETPTGGDVQSEEQPTSIEAPEAGLARQAAVSASLARKMREERRALMEQLRVGLIDEAGNPITAAGDDVQSEEPSGATMKIGDVERPVVANTAGQWTDTPGVTEIPPVSLALDPGVQEALAAKPPRKGRRS